ERLASWAWDAALLQECPPWWPAQLAAACDAHEHHALTSRNALLPLRRWIAQRWQDIIRSNGGGCDAILVRGEYHPAHPHHRAAAARTAAHRHRRRPARPPPARAAAGAAPSRST